MREIFWLMRTPIGKKLLTLCVSIAPLLAAGCQTSKQPETTIIDEFAGIDLKNVQYTAPPRTIDRLRETLGDLRPVPTNCAVVIEARENFLQKRVEDAANFGKYTAFSKTQQFASLAEVYRNIGRYRDAREILQTSLVVDNNARRAASLTQLALLELRLGNIDAAKRALARADTNWYRDGYAIYRPRGKLYVNAGQAALSHFEGEIELAEFYYRETFKFSRMASGFGATLNIIDLRKQYVQLLVNQGRLEEAEVAALEAVKKIQVSLSGNSYDGSLASPVIAMAIVLIELDRLQDAAYFSGIAVNMHEAGCSDAESIGLLEARSVYIDVLVAQGRFDAALEQFRKAEKDWLANPQILNRTLGRSISVIEAELFSGNKTWAEKKAADLISERTKDNGPESPDVAEIKGTLALVKELWADDQSRILAFREAASILLSSNDQGRKSQKVRRDRIYAGYISLLSDLYTAGDKLDPDSDIPFEMLQVAAAKRSGKVGLATTQAWLRGASDDQQLAELIRTEQNLTVESSIVAETISHLLASSEIHPEHPTIVKMRRRLDVLRKTKAKIRRATLEKNPALASLLIPRLTKLTDLEKGVENNQVLLVTQVEENRTHTWTYSKNSGLRYRAINLGEKEIGRYVAEIRRSTDPTRVTSISNLPDFNVTRAWQLYEMLLSHSESIWEEAAELVVIADGPLGQLPFSVLVTENVSIQRENDSEVLHDQYKRIPWLITRIPVTYQPDLSSLWLSRNRRASERPGKAFVGFGDPYFSKRQAKEAQIATSDISVADLSSGLSDVENFENAGKSLNLQSAGFELFSKRQAAKATIPEKEEASDVMDQPSIGFRYAPNTRSINSATLSRLPRLADTRDEIVAIGEILQANESTDLFLGVQANETNVKNTDLKEYAAISFATHGLVPGDLDGLYEPALALTSPSVANIDGDGLLTMTEVLSLSLTADIAVLSACNTAAADGRGSEAVSGLGRAFFYAGAKSLLVSHWPVYSAATTDLMTRFFRILATSPTIKRTEALRIAKIEQIEDSLQPINNGLNFSYAHPIFWAPFIIVGDGGREVIAIN